MFVASLVYINLLYALSSASDRNLKYSNKMRDPKGSELGQQSTLA